MYRDQNDVVLAFSDAVGIVFANSFETMTLWKTYHGELKATWKSFNWGQMITVGHISGNKNRPVCIRVGAFEINGRVVLTVEDTSRWVDHTMIKEWLVKNWPNLTTREHTDAMNFHNIYHDIQRQNEKAAA